MAPPLLLRVGLLVVAVLGLAEAQGNVSVAPTAAPGRPALTVRLINTVDQDTSIQERSPNPPDVLARFGNIIVGKHTGFQATRALVQFDAVNQSALPSNSVIRRATMTLHFERALRASFAPNEPLIARNVSVARLLVKWRAAVATYTLRASTRSWPGGSFDPLDPATAGAPLSTALISPGVTSGTVAWDVTAAAQLWLNGSAPNFGVVFFATNEDTNGGDLRFTSAEAAANPADDHTGQGPRLILELAPITTTPASTTTGSTTGTTTGTSTGSTTPSTTGSTTQSTTATTTPRPPATPTTVGGAQQTSGRPDGMLVALFVGAALVGALVLVCAIVLLVRRGQQRPGGAAKARSPGPVVQSGNADVFLHPNPLYDPTAKTVAEPAVTPGAVEPVYSVLMDLPPQPRHQQQQQPAPAPSDAAGMGAAVVPWPEGQYDVGAPTVWDEATYATYATSGVSEA